MVCITFGGGAFAKVSSKCRRPCPQHTVGSHCTPGGDAIAVAEDGPQAQCPHQERQCWSSTDVAEDAVPIATHGIKLVAREIALDVAAGNYQMTELRHVAGISNVVADALSRMWSPEPLEFPLQRRRVEGPGPRLRIQILEGRVKKNRSALKQPRFTGRSSLRVDFTSEDGEAQEGGGQKPHS